WLVIGFLFSFSFYREGAAFIRTKMLSGTAYIPEAMAFFTLFLIAFIAIKILGGMLKEIIQSVGLGLPDKILGLGFGIIKGIIVIGFILFIIRVQPLVNGGKILHGSMINRILSPNIEKVRQTVEDLKENLDV
ncbi:MAG: CvpA family protein, partial [Spirochaetaceae bacterium]|nr:CvpA family protein [Spirochaetaceae bacterium]